MSRSGSRSPARLLSLVLLVEPRLQRRVIVNHRTGIHLALTGQSLEGVGPWLGCAHLQRGLQSTARFGVAVDRAAMQWCRAAGRLRQRAMELELEYGRQEVPRIGRVGRNVILGARIEERLAARCRRP